MNRKFRKCLLTILQFEVIFKLFIFVLASPLIVRLYDLVLNHAVFNQDILFRFLSLKGIAVMLGVVLLAGGLVFYELSVIIQILACAHEDQDVTLATIMKQSILFPSLMKSVSLPLCLLYFLFFLPLAHLGYVNSLIPRIIVPAFITNELALTWYGQIGNLLIDFFTVFIALALLFVPILMVLKQEPFLAAVKDNFRLWKKMGKKNHLRIFTGTVVWKVMEQVMNFALPDAVFINPEFNRFLLKNLMVSG